MDAVNELHPPQRGVMKKSVDEGRDEVDYLPLKISSIAWLE